MTVEVITNSNVYIDGTSYFGKAKEVQLPELKHKMVEQKALGMYGTKEVAAGLEALEAKIKWSSWLADVIKKAANPYKQADLAFYGNIEVHGASGLESEKPAKCFMRGTFKGVPLGTGQPSEGMEIETALSVNYIKLVVDGSDLFEIDVDNNIYIVDGEDLLAQYRQNLGIS